MEISTYIDLIDSINNFDSEQFVDWYLNTIQYGSDLVEFDKIIKSICKDSTADKYYKLFNHLKPKNSDYPFLYNDLVQIVSDELDYFVSKCKKELIEKISDQSNLFKLRFELEAKNINTKKEFELLVQKISSHTYNTQVYLSGTSQLVDYTGTKYKFVVHKVEYTGYGYDGYYLETIKPNAIIFLESNESNEFYGLEFEGVGMANYNFDSVEVELNKYTGTNY